ncbi:hypothetical protein BJY01DRAFT_246871 [Aspergillus pseudoustus]|uniref:Fungal N-terminal domain-containing protein n=1 Tax=Aspergillus pseudoustus TaxID=1810923 RepID=A0ABR4K4G8_9EURO
MADPLRTTASVLTILDVVKKVIDTGKEIKNAPMSWQRYCEELEIVGHVQSVLKDVFDKADADRVRKLEIEINGQRESLVAFINGRLTRIKEQADDVLRAMGEAQPEKKGSWTRFTGRVKRTADSIQFFLEEEQIAHLLRSVEYTKSTLELALCIAQLRLAGSTGSLHQEVGIVLQGLKDEMVKQSNELDKLHHKSSQHVPTGLQNSDPSLSSTQSTFVQEMRPRPRGTQRTQTVVYPGTNQLNPRTVSGELPVKKNDSLNNPGVKKTEATAQEDSKTESLPLYSATDLNPISQPTVDCGTQCTWEVRQQIEFQIQDKAEAILITDKEFNLGECATSDREHYVFCVVQITTVLDQQICFLSKPCLTGSTCEHVMIDCLDTKSLFLGLPPMRFTLAFSHPGACIESSSGNASDAGPLQLQLCEECQVAGNCLHTLVESHGRLPAKCATQSKLFASASAHLWDEPGTPYPLDSSKRGLNDGDADHHTHRQTPQLSEHPEPDDDKRAFRLARNLTLTMPAKVPKLVDLDTLIKFILIVDKYQLADSPKQQARKWAELLWPARIPDMTEEDCIIWLWIFWKLDMEHEIRVLSRLVQRQATLRLNQVVDRYPLTLPRNIVGMYTLKQSNDGYLTVVKIK